MEDTTGYGLRVSAACDKDFRQHFKKNKVLASAVENKIKEILASPHRFKSLHGLLGGCFRVHVLGSFVLIYRVNEREHALELLRFAHHDEAYR